MSDRRTDTPLAHFLHWEQAQPDKVLLTQPYPDGRVVDYTWAEVGDQARRMAAHLRSLQFAPGSRIALLGRNSAHWIVADLAITMAGHVSVPVYPTMGAEQARYVLDHSESQLLFVGKLDGTAILTAYHWRRTLRARSRRHERRHRRLHGRCQEFHS